MKDLKIQPYHQSPTAPPSLPEHEGGQQHRLQELEGQVCLTSSEGHGEGPAERKSPFASVCDAEEKEGQDSFLFLSFCGHPSLKLALLRPHLQRALLITTEPAECFLPTLLPGKDP